MFAIVEENSKRTSSPSNSLESRKSHTHSTCSVVNCKNLPACTRTDYGDDDQVILNFIKKTEKSRTNRNKLHLQFQLIFNFKSKILVRYIFHVLIENLTMKIFRFQYFVL